MTLTSRFYILSTIIIALFLLGFGFDPVFTAAKIALAVLVIATLADLCLLYFTAGKMDAVRDCNERFSNGDENKVSITLCNPYSFRTKVQVIDEMPIEFQMRDFVMQGTFDKHEERTVTYTLTPHHRGTYNFDRIRIFFTSPLCLVQRRFTRGTPQDVKVFPSFSRLSLYSLIADHQQMDEYGIKRVRRVGADTEFDQIKDYVQGDEYRHINWRASARTNTLKVNVYQQERSMDVYCIIDKGRMMQQTASGLTFLEHSINAALALCHVATKKEDKAGLTAFSSTVDTHVPASRLGAQMQKLMEALYNQKTSFSESDYSALSTTFLKRVTKRSLIILFANFSTLNALRRELPYLRQLSTRHRLIVVVFKDQQILDFIAKKPANTEEYYQQIFVEKYHKEKLQLLHTLIQNNITPLYTLPEHLSVNLINKYIEVRRF